MSKLSIIVALLTCTLVSSIVVNVPKCTDDHKPNISPFFYTVNGSIDNTTTAHMCHDDTYLHIRWFSVDEDVISTYTKCNDPLYNEDAVQVFLATNGSYPNHYFQFEVSPHSQLFFADITNNNLNCSNLGTVYYPCTSATYSGTLTGKGWDAHLQIDLTIIGRGKKQDTYKGNLYRIDKSKTKPTRYLAFNPANSSPACFHQPLKFVQFHLV